MFISDEEKARILKETGKDVRGYCDECGAPFCSTERVWLWKWLGFKLVLCRKCR